MLVLLFLLLDPVLARDSRLDFCKTSCSQPGTDRICGLGTSGNCTELCLRYPASGECTTWPFDMLPEYESVPGPRNLVVTPVDGSPSGQDAISITWQPSGDAIRCLKGFQVHVIEMSPAGSSNCHQIILGFDVTLSHEDNQKRFSHIVRNLRPDTAYTITVRSLPTRRTSEGDDDSFLKETYRTRSCESIPGCKRKVSPSNWNPPQPKVTTVGRSVTIRARTARQFNIRSYNLFLGKPSRRDPYPDVISVVHKRLSPKESKKKYFQHTFIDVQPGQHTLQYSVDARDPYRSYPVQFTVRDWIPGDLRVQQSCRNVTVQFEGPPPEYNLSTCNVSLTRKSYPERTWTQSTALGPNVTTIFTDLKPDIYSVKVSSPYPDASPVVEKIIELKDWVPKRQDITLKVKTVKVKTVKVRVGRGRSSGHSSGRASGKSRRRNSKNRSGGRKKEERRVRLTFARPEPRLKYDYSGFYVYFGKDPASLERQEVARPEGENWNNVTVVMKDVPSGVQFFQVSAPYEDALRSELVMVRVRRPRGKNKNRRHGGRRRKQQRNSSQNGLWTSNEVTEPVKHVM